MTVIRYIVRPRNILTTPRLLKEALGARRTLGWPTEGSRKPSWFKDFFLYYPHIEELEETHTNAWTQTQLDTYRSCRDFQSSNKPTQRGYLAEAGFRTPATYTLHSDCIGDDDGVEHYVVRPLRHSRGLNYRIIDDPTTGWDPQTEYISELYPKRHEYRVIVSRGVPIITLLKRIPEGLSSSLPWNHANGSTFITVTDPQHNRLRHTNVYDIIRSSTLLRGFDLVGLDVMYGREGDYRVCELNLCPAMTINTNLQKVAQHVRDTPRQ
jgi:hypothetical protein